MKLFVFIILIFVQFFSPKIYGQKIYGQKCLDDIFEIEVKSNNPNEIEINYYDRNRDEFKYSPKFRSTVPKDHLISFEFISIQKKDSIEKELFKTEELDTLKRGIAICQIHIPSGKIVSVSFALQNKMDKNKLKKLKDEIEKNLYYEIVLHAELEKEGYWGRSFPIFVSRRRK